MRVVERQLELAVTFFGNKKPYQKLFQQFKQKYESLGRIGGNVSIQQFSMEELEVIGGFFGLPAQALKKRGMISLLQFEKQLKETRFDGIQLKQLLDAYFGEVILSNREKEQIRKEKLAQTLQKFKKRFPQLNFWFAFLKEHPQEGRWIVRFAEENKEKFAKYVAILSKAVQSLPEKAQRLPFFSHQITGQPHSFDVNRDLGKMFLHVLSTLRFVQGKYDHFFVPTDTETINELLIYYKLYRDDLLNFVTIANLYGETEFGKDKVWKAAVKQQSVQIVPLREMMRQVRVYPAVGKKVWIVENSGVFSTLLDYTLHAPLVCTNGQFTLAVYQLLDLLVKENCTLYYAGDFDPEGLRMAERLVHRYPNHLKLWRMDIKTYQESEPSKPISDERLEQLNGLKHGELIKVGDEMKRIKSAGYQEAIIQWLIHDIQNNCKIK